MTEKTQHNSVLELCAGIYKLTSTFPAEEIDGLSRQLRQTAVSLAVRTAPVCEQKSVALGLLREIEVMLIVAERLGFAAPEKIVEVRNLSQNITEKLAETVRPHPVDTDSGGLPGRVPVGGIITPQ